MPKKIKQKQKVSQKVIQNVIVKVGEMRKKRKARRRAKRASKETEGVSSFRMGTSIPPSVTYVSQPTQFTPYMPKEFEEVYRTVKDLYGKKEVEPVGLMDLAPVAEPLKPKAKEILEDKEIVIPVAKAKVKEIDVSNPSPDVIFTDPIKDKSLDYKPIADLNTFPQEELNRNDDLYVTKSKRIPDLREKELSEAELKQFEIDVAEMRRQRQAVKQSKQKYDKAYYSQKYLETFGQQPPERVTKSELRAAIKNNQPL